MSEKDFIITFRPADEGKVQIVLYSDRNKLATAGRPMKTARSLFTLAVEKRQPPPPSFVEIEPSTLGELRDNDEDDGWWKVNSAGDKISEWLLGEDVKESLATVFESLGDDQKVRLILSADKNLREVFDPSQVPVELMRPELQDTPYSISPKVASIIYQLDQGGRADLPASALDWPLRVLVVRSNPQDRGLAVPEAAPVKRMIERLGETFGPGAVVVDVLSSEENEKKAKEEGKEEVEKVVTWDAFTRKLKAAPDPYNILIYLGHGAIREADASSCLQFEDGAGHRDVPHYNLIVPFQNVAVPVVLLMGCLTADQITEEKFQNLHKRKMSEWLRGSRGVAQALINSLDTRTLLVVGMRYRLDAGDAGLFLEHFFDSLLRITRGNVEAAVRNARTELRMKSRFPAAFSAPVIFRRLRPDPEEDEPLLPFIANKEYVPTACSGPAGDWETPRVFAWKQLIQISWTQRAEADKKSYLSFLADVEKKLIHDAVEEAPLILPEMVTILPGETGSFAVKLHGSLGAGRIEKLTGQLIFDREDIVVEKTPTSDELRAKGYRASTDTHGQVVQFTIEPDGDVLPLENVTLFEVEVKVGKEVGLLSPVSISTLRSTPPRKVCPGTNAILIPPP